MDVTLLYNGYNIQRRKMYTLSPRNNLKSQIDIEWPASLHHEELSPLSQLRQRQVEHTRQMAEQHNTFVDGYLSRELNLNDSRLHKVKAIDKQESSQKRSESAYWTSSVLSSRQTGQSLDLKLPKITKQEETDKKKSIVSQLITDRPRSYFSVLLKDRLKKYCQQ